MKKLSYEKWCTSLISNLADYFNLSGWVLQINFSKESKEGSEECYAHIVTDSTYSHATVTYFPESKKDFDSGKIDRLVRASVHEISHILIDPLHEHMCPFLSDVTRPFYNRDLENTTQRIAMVIGKNLPKSIIPPR